MYNYRQNINNLCNIQSYEKFQFTLSTERSRADRNKQQFSVLVCEVDFESTDIATTIQFVNQISTCIRAYDEIGWFNKKSIGLLLCDTTNEGAKRIIDEFKQVNDINSHVGNYEIYVYP